MSLSEQLTIDTVIFDIGNVLYRWDLRCLFEKLIDDERELDWFLDNVVTPEWHFQHDAGRPFDEMVAERSTEFPQQAHLIQAYADRFPESIPGPVVGVHELVERLAGKNVPIFGLSNFGADSWAMFRPTASIFDHFADIVISGQEHLTKPDPAIFRLALDRFRADAAQCLFVDDRPENIEAGQQLGIRGHLFRDAATLEKELVALALL